MYLIIFHFQVAREDQPKFIKQLDGLKEFWQEYGFSFSLYRDTVNTDRIMQILLTEKTIDELTLLIKKDLRAKSVFESIKETKSQVIVKVLEQIV
jgi:hypothetical protein